MNHFDADYAYREKAWRQLHKDSMSYITQILQSTSHRTAAVQLPTTHHKDNLSIYQQDLALNN